MIVFGTKPKIETNDSLRWAILVTYLFLINIINLKLLISIIGETFAKQQISRVALGYQMKANYLVELAYLRKDMQEFCRCGKNYIKDVEKHFHLLYYEDSQGQVNN